MKNLDFTGRPGLIIGILSKNTKGYGFIMPENDEGGDLFVSPAMMNHAMHGDRVAAELLPPPNDRKRRGKEHTKDRGKYRDEKSTKSSPHDESKSGRNTRSQQDAHKKREGRIVAILHHANDEIVGVFQLSKRFGFVVPDNQPGDEDIFIRSSDCNGAKTGEKVLVKITKWPTDEQSAEGRVIERIGQPGDPAVDLKCLIRQYRLPEVFSEKVQREADEAPAALSADDLAGREDLRSRTIITIDGADAKDLDDAVSVEKLPSGHYLLGVHIADVSHYVRESSKLDHEALKRGCSVYLIDTVIPMLPKNISNGICSLHSGVDRLTLSVEMEINPEGKTVSHRIFESVIHSAERMIYTDVSDMLEQENADLIEKYRHIYQDLQYMDELYQILSAARARRGSVDFDLDETFITLNEEGLPIDISVSERRRANRLIEEFMLKANEVIAEHHFRLDLPFVYRVHESPDPDKIDAFKKFAGNFGYFLKGSSSGIHPKALHELVKAVAGTPHEHIINTVMLRSMQKALYLPECKGHFGLGLKYYCHFTSPIRRYPDLIIHRIIKENLRRSPDAERRAVLKHKAEEASKRSSETERTAQEIERELEKLKKAQYMLSYIGESFEGVISGVTSFALFVTLSNTIEGIIRFHDLHDDYYTFEKEKYRVVGDHTKKTYTLGDPLSIRVLDVDLDAREVVFGLEDKKNGWY